MILPSFQEYLSLSQTARIVPVVQKFNGDMFTPISVFRRFGMRPYSFLLESVVNGERWARYSIMGRNPLLTFSVEKGVTTYRKNNKEFPASLLGKDPVSQIKALSAQYQAPKFSYVQHFYCGLVGFFGYDFVRYSEILPDNNPDTLGIADCSLLVPGEVIVFDHLKNELTLIVNVESDGGADAYSRAAFRLGEINDELTKGAAPALSKVHPADLRFVSATTKDEYMASVEKAKAFIRDGDIFQCVPSQRFSADYAGDPLPIYRALRNVNPSPYLFYLQFEDAAIVGSSPEMLVRVTDGVIETCPIAGTRARGKTDAEDLALEIELLADEKEISEHYMLVDLARNDVGKVSKIGTVAAKNVGHVERYSHVMHIVTNVEGKLSDAYTPVDVLCSILPAGTLSGAPKVRAMEIIDEIEPLRRGPYGGAVGYIGFDGNLDTCITIRSAVIHDGKIHVQAGAGIVADSDPEKEYQESVNKARALFVALEKAGDMR